MAQDVIYKKKIEEKLRMYLNLTSGKASWVADLLSPANVDILKQNRSDVWNWVNQGSAVSAPLLPPEFPSEFFVVKLGPICVGAGSPAPLLSEIISLPDPNSVVSQSIRKVNAGEYMMTLSLSSHEAYSALTLNVRKSEWYEKSFWGSIPTKEYGSVPVCYSVTSLAIIACSHNNGLMGQTLGSLPLESDRQVWLDSELALIDASIIGAASSAAAQSSLKLQKTVLHASVDPKAICWKGGPTRAKSQCTIGGHRLAHRLGLGIGALSANREVFTFLQEWFSKRIQPYTIPSQGEPPDDAYVRLHFLLATCMERQEQEGKGTVSGDLKTPLHALSLFDPETNPSGIFLCPTYLPLHAIRLCEWFESALPELDLDMAGNKVEAHFLHIDGEGEFFQLHTETQGCVIIFTGMNETVEKDLVTEIFQKFRTHDISQSFQMLSSLTRAICREFTLSRPDVVFAGDRAACPVASQPGKANDKILPWIESDITNWFWFIEGVPGTDFFCVRSSIDDTNVSGFKNLIDCAVGKVSGDVCICTRVFGAEWLRQCSLTHPQMWHGYPQSGAGRFKSLIEPCHWTVLYYAIADLIKARAITFEQDKVEIILVTPIV